MSYVMTTTHPNPPPGNCAAIAKQSALFIQKVADSKGNPANDHQLLYNKID